MSNVQLKKKLYPYAVLRKFYHFFVTIRHLFAVSTTRNQLQVWALSWTVCVGCSPISLLLSFSCSRPLCQINLLQKRYRICLGVWEMIYFKTGITCYVIMLCDSLPTVSAYLIYNL